MNPVAALLFFITIVNFFLGALVFFRNHKNPLHVSLSRFIFLVAAWMFCMGAFYQVKSTDYAFWWIRWTYVFGVVIANTLIYFSLVFPDGSTVSLKQRLLIYIPAFPMIAAILLVPKFLFKDIVEHYWWKDVKLGTPEYIFYTIYFVVVYFGAIAILFKKYIAYSGNLKLKTAYVLSAVFIAGSLGAIFDLLFPWLNLYKYIWLGPIGTLIMVGIFIYAIVKHRFLDISLIIARAIAYTLILGFIGALYAIAGILIGSSFFPVKVSFIQLLPFAGLTLVVILSFDKVRDFFERLTDKVFFKGRYDTQQLFYILGRIMSTNIELDILTNKLLETIISQMRITRGVFILFGDEPKIYDIISNGFENEIDLSYDDLAPFSTEAELIIFDEIEENLLKQLMRKYGFSILRRMIVEERIVGYLALGEKSSGDIYSQQDVKVLEIIGSEIAIAIQNAKSFDKIKKFNVTLIQEITKATVDLKQANLKLKQLDKLKDDFVSVASHELRTPMTAIRSYVWMALHKSDIHLSQKLERYLYRTLVSTERLINLVNDMLNVSRIESGKIEIKPQAFDIVSLVNEVMEEVRAKADEKNLKLIVLEHKLPQMFADLDKVHQVLLNLIGNSLKFSYPGGIITADFLINGGMIEVSIKDQGSGIPKEDQVKLFHKFSRLDNSYTSMSISSGSGTGLGLYISRSLIDLMKGTIGVKSEGEDKGCIFTFSLPVATKEILANQDKFKTTPVDDSKPLEPVAI